jgi:hypothetical protein
MLACDTRAETQALRRPGSSINALSNPAGRREAAFATSRVPRPSGSLSTPHCSIQGERLTRHRSSPTSCEGSFTAQVQEEQPHLYAQCVEVSRGKMDVREQGYSYQLQQRAVGHMFTRDAQLCMRHCVLRLVEGGTRHESLNQASGPCWSSTEIFVTKWADASRVLSAAVGRHCSSPTSSAPLGAGDSSAATNFGCEHRHMGDGP